MKKTFYLIFFFNMVCLCEALCQSQQNISNNLLSAKLVVISYKFSYQERHLLRVEITNNSNDTIGFQHVGSIYYLGTKKYRFYDQDTDIFINQGDKTISSDEIRPKTPIMTHYVVRLKTIPPHETKLFGFGYIGNLVKDFNLLENKPFRINVVMYCSGRDALSDSSVQYLKEHPSVRLITDTIYTQSTEYLNTTIDLFLTKIELDGFLKVPIMLYRDIFKLEKYSDFIMLVLSFVVELATMYAVRYQRKLVWKLFGLFIITLNTLLIIDILIFIYYGY